MRDLYLALRQRVGAGVARPDMRRWRERSYREQEAAG